MKRLNMLLCFLVMASTSAIQAQNDSIFFWKSGLLIAKRSIKPADLDSITFKRPTVNLSQVTICDQTWATQNLDITAYSDGTPIPQVTDPTLWGNLTTGAWCYYNNDPAYGVIYGKLYNWYAVAGIYDAASLSNPELRKKIAPTGWHMPTDDEWSELINCLDTNANGGATIPNIAGGKMKEAGTSHWLTPNTEATNSSGFTGLPGGCRYNDGTFSAIFSAANWWSSSEYVSGPYAWYRNLLSPDGFAYRGFYDKPDGFSVRCIKD